MGPTKVAVISPCGWGNLGDAAIIDALIDGVRRRLPGAELVGFTLNPEDTARRHGIEAHESLGYSLPGFLVKPNDRESGGGEGEVPASAGPSRPSLRTRVGQTPVLGSALRWARRGVHEQRSYREAAGRIRGFRYVVIAGGGQLDDFWGGPFGQPYVLWRWSRLARGASAAFVVLSVGTGSLGPALSRTLVKRALAGASYRSFRDRGSRELLADMPVVREDPVVPDLAYSLALGSRSREARARGNGAGDRLVFGLSPIAYGDPRAWPVEALQIYQRHVSTTAGMARRLIDAGHEVVLFTTGISDQRPAQEIAGQVRAAGASPEALARLRVTDVGSVGALLDILAATDVVVASRLHAVLLAHVMGRPVLAVSPERKVDALMAGMDQSDYCLPLKDFDPDLGWARLMQAAERRAALAAAIRERTAGYRAAVEAQYDRVFGGAPAPAA